MSNLLPLLLITPSHSTQRLLMQKISNLQLFDIDIVKNSEEAIQHLKSQKYRFIISEIDIGDVDGWSLSSLIRSDLYISDKKIPIVLITDTHCERIAEATAKSFGINAVVTIDEIGTINQVLADALSSDIPVKTQLSVLTVVDDPVLQENLADLLREQFYDTYVTSTKEALAQVRQHSFDLVLIDSGLSEETILPFISALKREKTSTSIVVIVPKNDTNKAEYYITLGASDFIYNPVNASRFINICVRAAQRNDFIISNKQFADKVIQLNNRDLQYRNLSNAHTKLLENLSSVVIELDTNGRIRFLNPAWQVLTGFAIEDSIGLPFSDFIEFDAIGSVSFNNKLADLLSRNVKSATAEVQISTIKNKSVWVEVRLHQLIKNGLIEGLTATLDNINERKKAQQELQHLAMHDTLTGLFNRYYFDSALNRLTLLASRSKLKHSILYIDLDHFKIINDTEGHQTGDLVLKEVAQSLSQ